MPVLCSSFVHFISLGFAAESETFEQYDKDVKDSFDPKDLKLAIKEAVADFKSDKKIVEAGDLRPGYAIQFYTPGKPRTPEYLVRVFISLVCCPSRLLYFILFFFVLANVHYRIYRQLGVHLRKRRSLHRTCFLSF